MSTRELIEGNPVLIVIDIQGGDSTNVDHEAIPSTLSRSCSSKRHIVGTWWTSGVSWTASRTSTCSKVIPEPRSPRRSDYDQTTT